MEIRRSARVRDVGSRVILEIYDGRTQNVEIIDVHHRFVPDRVRLPDCATTSGRIG